MSGAKLFFVNIAALMNGHDVKPKIFFGNVILQLLPAVLQKVAAISSQRPLHAQLLLFAA